VAQVNAVMKQEENGNLKETTSHSGGDNEIVSDYYNACLQNWYLPDDTIGRHADDERDLLPRWPIFSLSWGGTRRFVLRPKSQTTQKTEFWLKDGDLLVMGGRTQETHYHEVPKRRMTMDPTTGRRINWTIRAFRTKK
jgi:alkylated DNA repair dioxygenase AlkB